MNTVIEGDLLWSPTPETIAQANLTHYLAWLEVTKALPFDNYQELWSWSVSEPAAFWRSIWDYFAVTASKQPTEILATSEMPSAQWFVGARLNYAENIFARMSAEQPVIWYRDEAGPLIHITKAQLHGQVSALAQALRALGVSRGDRVVAYLPNIPQAIVGLLATASLGAIWSSCAPDFGSRSVLDRFSQIEPKVLLTVDGYRYNGKVYDRLGVVRELQENLPTLRKSILIPLVGADLSQDALADTLYWEDALAAGDPELPLAFAQLPFDHPLWVLYSSGTTGLPKPIVHGHGGIVLEHLKETVLHMDLKPADRFYWYTSTGWMMWNYVTGALLSGCAIVLYNGSPNYPDLNAQWRLAEQTGLTYFGTSAAFIHACLKENLAPNLDIRLDRIRALGSTGSPLSPAGFQWVYEHVNPNLALESFSGGTDLCTGFLGGVRTQPIYAGEIQAASLGAGVRAFDEAGRSVLNEVGELVITQPMPSMPLYFWNDPQNRRYRESYFAMFPGIWRHGDWIKINERGGCVIYGRSDSTINRYGVRMGTSEIYQAVQDLPEVQDSLAIDLEGLDGEPYMPLFVVLAPGVSLDQPLKDAINRKIRADISPRHVPSEIIPIDEVPYTLSGKKMEVPVRKILMGRPLEEAANPGAMRNPEAIQFFVDFAITRGQARDGRSSA